MFPGLARDRASLVTSGSRAGRLLLAPPRGFIVVDGACGPLKRVALVVVIAGAASACSERAPVVNAPPPAEATPRRPPAPADPAPDPAAAAVTPTEDELARRRRLEAERIGPIEDDTESFARALDELSARTKLGDVVAIRSFFTERVHMSPLPSGTPKSTRQITPWLKKHKWAHPPAREVSANQLVDEQEAWLSRLSRVEDMRWKVKKSRYGDAPGSLVTQVALKIVGRDTAGKRTWTKLRADVITSRDTEDRWRISRLAVTSLVSLVADRDMFADVSDAAGLALPATTRQPAELPGLSVSAMQQSFTGVSVGDLDNDGLMDVILAGRDQAWVYLNRGDGTFEDRAAALGLEAPVQTKVSAVPLLVDVDDDGDSDLFVAATGRFALYDNRLIPDGTLAFEDVSARAGVEREAWAYSAVAGDFTGDGKVDIYVTSYNDWPRVLPDKWHAATNGTANLMFVNRGDGTFTEEAAARGVAGQRWSFAAAAADVDGDGDLDLYVANDYGSGSTLYLNDGSGHFTDTGAERGARDIGAGMGASFGDYDNDGDLDLHLTNMSSSAAARIFGRLNTTDLPALAHFKHLASGNVLFANAGDGSFRDVTTEAGPLKAGWAWGGGFIDIDNDGWEDVHAPNGFLSGHAIHDT